MVEANQNENEMMQALDRIREQIDALHEMESKWPVSVDENNLKAVQALVDEKQKIINNIQTLLENQPLLKNLNAEQVTLNKEYTKGQEKVSDIRQLVKQIMVMHNEHTFQLKHKSDELQHAIDDVQKALNLIRTYNGEGRKGSKIDATG